MNVTQINSKRGGEDEVEGDGGMEDGDGEMVMEKISSGRMR